ncbi:tyrosine-type recombinase/integrase [Roseovarius pacificus]|uniref:tyrosine-type recombinase/integrase n=1 Tax=Roseovarius pacificus TaxID=337701 RepID=UPI00403A5375
MANIRLKYVIEDTDRHGNVRLYYRRSGYPKIRLRGPMGSPEFLSDYRRAHANHGKPKPQPRGARLRKAKAGTMKWLCGEYYKSPMFRQLDPSTQRTRRSILERFCENKGDGEKPYAQMLPRHLRNRRDAMMGTPAAANTMIKTVRQLFKFAVRYDLHDTNPAEQVEYLVTNSDGYHSWTLAEIEKYEKAHPVGTTARLALALALYTGQRRSDLVAFGPGNVQVDGEGVRWLVFTQHKGRNRHPVRLEIPMIPELERIIDATEAVGETFLLNGYGRPFTSAGFGNRFRKWCDDAELSHCSVHGLRKAAAKRLAEMGCSEFEIMAITGHQTSKEVTRYTKGASQRTRAERALGKMMQEQNGGKSVPLFASQESGGTKPRSKYLIEKEEKIKWQPVGPSHYIISQSPCLSNSPLNLIL